MRSDQPAEPPLVSPVPFGKSNLGLPGRIGYYARRAVQEFGVELISAPTLPHLFDDLPFEPDIIHLHNVRENLLRLADVEALCRRAPVVWTWHDMWPMTGHCAYSLECDRHNVGCGRCPHTDVYVRIRFDFSRLNQSRRRHMYEQVAQRMPGRLQMACSSRWLTDLARESVAACLPVHHVDTGTDTRVFRPASDDERAALRERMGIGKGSVAVLFAANRGRTNPFKDYATLRQAVETLRNERSDLAFVTVGDSGPDTRSDEIALGVLDTSESMADAYRAADIYVLSTRADNQPLTVLEAMACGLPVVGSAVGGVPELIEEGKTGRLVAPGDIDAMARAIGELADAPDARKTMGDAARGRVVERYDVHCMGRAYADLYERILSQNRKNARR